MQRIQVYLYPNRITVVTNLDTNSPTNVEYRIVYNRNVKLYKHIDNIIEIELKNNDQKRIEIGNRAVLLILTDQQGNVIDTYRAEILEDSTIVGLARITIPASALNILDPQYLKFHVTLADIIQSTPTSSTLGNYKITYVDSQFDAIGTIELIETFKLGNADNQTKTIKYDRWTKETNYQSSRWEDRKVYYNSEAIPLDQYKAVNRGIEIKAYFVNFTGTVIIQGTKTEVIGNESFRDSKIFFQQDYVSFTSGNWETTLQLSNTPLSQLLDYKYLRVRYFNTTGSIDYILVSM